ncbi:MAG TPA: hypothetical protein VGR21_09855, partial [Cryptosporangiaceae bacterium]|nr:hypothetical protein [Cryptosporangiaceae bacterium]
AAASGRPRRPPVWLMVAAFSAASAAVALGWLDYRAGKVAEAARQARAAAVVDSERLFSYDYRRIDADIAETKRRLTGQMASDYAKTSAPLATLAVRYKGVVTASVSAAGIVRADADEVVVLLFLNQETTQSQVSTRKVDQNRVRVTMKKVDDDWRIAKAEAL